MDTMGIIWLVIYSIIGSIAIWRLKSASASKRTHKQDDDNSYKSNSVKSITEGQERPCNNISLSSATRNESYDNSNENTGDENVENGIPHSKASITRRKRVRQSKQRST